MNGLKRTVQHPLPRRGESSSESVADKGNQRSSGASVKQPKQLEPADEVILAKQSSCDTCHGCFRPTQVQGFPQHQGQSWKPACGTHMSHGETVFLDEWSNNLSFCQHPGCKTSLGGHRACSDLTCV